MQQPSGPFTLTYSLARPYPFPHFTWLIAFEFFIASVLFSLFSFLTTGYELASIYSPNPNGTESRLVFRALPNILTSKTRPVCQSISIDVGSRFSTTNSALTYTLENVQEGNVTFSSMIYHKNPLEDCSVNDVLLAITSSTREPGQIALSAYGIDLTSSVTCFISSANTRKMVNLTATYNYVPSTVNIYGRMGKFPGRDPLNKASLFWGEEALDLYWVSLSRTYENYVNTQPANQSSYTRAALYMTPGPDPSDITSDNFFNGVHRLIGYEGSSPSVEYIQDPVNVTRLAYLKPFWRPADSLAKIFYSTIVTDLGQIDHQPNILTSPDLLQAFTANFSNINATEGQNRDGLLIRPNRILQDYNSVKVLTGPLSISVSTIAGTYLCQVPRLKSTSNLILSIIIADLVLIQALWTITSWIATWTISRRDEKAHWCESCLIRESEKPPTAPQHYVPFSYPSKGDDYYNVSVTELSETRSLIHR